MNGRKRRILTDTSGMVVVAAVHAADIQDRDGPPSLLNRSAFRWLRHVFADGGYAREKLERSFIPLGAWTIEIVETVGRGQKLRVTASPLGRADAHLDQPQPPARQGL